MKTSRRYCRPKSLVALWWGIAALGIPLWSGGVLAASVRVEDPRCEYLSEPLGIEAAQPRLSWRLGAVDASGRGQSQTRYRLLVASAASALAQDKGDLWDSGEVQSDASVQIAYAGKALASGQECYWKVRVADERGEWSDWSSTARWTMGLPQPGDWTAKWIGTGEQFVKGQGWPPPDNRIPDPWFRKTFDLKEAPTRAVVYVASIGYHELYVNGQRVGDAVLSPGATDHRHRARYVAYEVASHLKPGRNVLGLWLGVSWSIFPQYKTADKPTSPIVLAQADLYSADGRKLRIGTDETWKTHPSPNTLLGVWDFMHFGGELYDARRELPEWCAAELDDSAWKGVSVFTPRLALSSEQCPPNRRVQALSPVGIREVAPGTYRIDMGTNYAGWFEMDLTGAAGDRVDFQFSERENEAMTHRLHSAYIMGPKGRGTFQNRFNYGVGRWVQVAGLKRKPEPAEIRGWLVRTDYRRASDFECDQPLLNRIYRTALWTFENLSLGGYVVDCPQRERMGYGGDAHATTRMGMDSFDLAAFYTKWSQDWRDVQGADGNLPYTAPTYWGGGGPGWSGYCITLPWEMYLRYGDTRILAENLPTMQRWLGFLETQSTNDLLKRWGGEWDFLGDWLWPGAEGVNGNTRETLFYNNCYWLYNLRLASRIAEVLGNGDLAKSYRGRADGVRAAIHKTFFNAADSSYVNGFPAYLAIALLEEVPPAESRPAVWARLEREIRDHRKGHIHAGITGGAFLFKTLMENGRHDLIYTMVRQEDYPGWGDMLRRGATTFYEDWECKLSYLHSSYLYVGAWFVEGLGGIQHPATPGLQRFVIEPWIHQQNGPRRVRAHHDSLYGRIATQWEWTGDRLQLRVTVPPNTQAELRLHALKPESLRESGQPLNQSRGLTVGGNQSGVTVLRLAAGQYSLEGQRAGEP